MAVIEEAIPDGAFSHDHYRRAFAKFDSKDGAFTPTWNWGALAFSLFWYAYRGMWPKAGLLLVLALITGGIAAPFIWLYSGMVGDYDFYLLKRRRTQFWK